MAETEELIKEDLNRILTKAKIEDSRLIAFNLYDSEKSYVEISCKAGNQIYIQAYGPQSERVPAFYYALHKLGFLFPHPQQQISPDFKTMRLNGCDKKFEWNPTLKYRGFHYNTLAANEWSQSFYLNQKETAEASIWWLAHNMQNIMQIDLLRTPIGAWGAQLNPLFKLANDLGIRVGISVTLTKLKERSYNLIPYWSSLIYFSSDQFISNRMAKFVTEFPFQFVTVDLGNVDIPIIDQIKNLKWLEILGSNLKNNKKSLFVKVNPSIQSFSSKYGNYNFLATKASPNVGILARTMFNYSLNDPEAPMYGRKNFSDIKELILREKNNRPVWYMPQTSHLFGMDVDIPLFLTDYLIARTQDVEFIQSIGIQGQLTMSSGQELGHWLFDWHLAMLSLREYKNDPYATLTLLGENKAIWEKILNFQNKYFKINGLISTLSSETIFDELPLQIPSHKRILFRDLEKNETYLRADIQQLENAEKEIPPINEVKTEELKMLLTVTHYRIQHALYLRKALIHRNQRELYSNWFAKAQGVRTTAAKIMEQYVTKYNRYSKLNVFDNYESPTSYDFGYGLPAKNLFYWKREEDIVDENVISPFHSNLYNLIDYIF
jgi:hypothetical protein